MATKNRLENLKVTLAKSRFLIKNERIIFTILDDGSSDGTFDFIKETYPEINLIRNNKSRGIFYSRNRLFNNVTTKYAITIDDDVNFLQEFQVDEIKDYFDNHLDCSVMAFRIFWGEELPKSQNTAESACIVKSFGAGAHAIRMSSWKKISQLPVWFRFYGEEDFIALELLKIGQYVHYTPQFLVHHRVNLKKRKKDKDYLTRSRRSLRSGWYLYFLFYPLRHIPKKFIYSIWMQIRLKVFKGDLKALATIILALGDVALNSTRLIRERKPINPSIYKKYIKLPEAKLYWTPINSKL
jgi:GT2 family glycosyltransferase